MRRERPGTTLALLFLLALILRLAYLFQADESPLFDAPVVDARTYVRSALYLAEGAWEGKSEPFWQPPLYPYLLGALFSLFGESYYLPRLLQALAGAATCGLLFLLGRRAFSPAVGWLAAGMAALYGPFIYFEGELLPAALATTCHVVLLLALLWAAQGTGWNRWLLAGLLLGASGLLVANVFLFAPVVLVWGIFRVPAAASPDTGSRRPRLCQLAAFVLGIVLVVAPVTLRNRIVGGEWVLVSHNAGVNFYIGNNPDYDATVAIRPGRPWFDLLNRPEREAHIIGKGAGSRYFFARSWEFISGDPAGFFKLLARKVYLFWRGDEIPRNLDPYYARTYAPILQVLLWKHGLAFPFGLVSPLALLGLFFFLHSPARRTPAGSLVLLFTATYALSVVLFFITGRYRLPVVPLLLLFAAHGMLTLLRQRGGRLALSGAALIVLLLGTNAGVGAMDTRGDAYQHFWLGMAFEEKGMKANARREYRRAVELDPAHEGALEGLAATAQQRPEEAIEAWRQLLHHYPDRDDIRLNLADLLVLKADYPPAIELYQDLIPRRSDWAALHGRLAHAYLMTDSPEKAITAYQKTLALNPDSLQVRYQLARTYQACGQEDQAVQEYTRLLEQQPDHVEARCYLGDLLLTRGEENQAEPHLKKALSVDPHSTHARRSLAGLEVRRGQYQAAIQHCLALLALEPDDLQARQALAHLYFKTGQKEKGEIEHERYERGRREQRMRREVEEEQGKILEQMMETLR